MTGIALAMHGGVRCGAKLHSSPAHGLPWDAVPPDDAKLYTPSIAGRNLMGWRQAQVTPPAIPSAMILTMACGEYSRVAMGGDKYRGRFLVGRYQGPHPKFPAGISTSPGRER
ncbi:hypothetical protein GCM10011342_14310 [Aquisalinus flavus]|uniref:Uncharacterized protein n=1 Tax=Aquisalinus flavus TaxID=1526572 RepID=A0A8J2Y6R3_9PROT|nr:hypothetical protein GCM10011342_14310 [Aquisalinus flavus]